MSTQLIPGFVWRWGVFQDHQAFVVKSDGHDDSEWDWRTCLGVALSIAGALTSAYNNGMSKEYKIWSELWDRAGYAGE